MLDISRDPRWGRTEETFGEDWPYRELKKFRLRGGLKIKYIAVYS